MLLTERPHGIEPVTAPVGEFCLRLQGDGDGERVVPLPAGKSTIGSSPRCTLRIVQPGVAPVHCLIVANDGRLSVRRWASDALLNGMPFDDAALGLGDRLTIGPVELQVQADVAEAPPSWDAEQPAHDPAPPEHVAEQASEQHDAEVAGEFHSDAEVPPAAPSVDRLTSSAAEVVFQRLRTSRTLARERNRKMLAALRRQREAHRELANRVEHLAREVQATRGENEGLRSELGQAREALAAAESRMGAADSLVQERDQLAAERERLAAEQARLAEEIARVGDEHGHIGEENARVASENARLAEEQAALAEQVEHARNERQQAVDALERFERQHEEQRADFARERAEWDELRNGWQSRMAGQVQRIEDLTRELDRLREDPLADEHEADEVASGEADAEPGSAERDPSDTWDSGDWPGVVSAGDETAPASSEVRSPVELPSDQSVAPAVDADGWQAEAHRDARSHGHPSAEEPVELAATEKGSGSDWSSDSTSDSHLRDSELAAVHEFSLWSQEPEGPPVEADESAEADVEDASESFIAEEDEPEPVVESHAAAVVGEALDTAPPRPPRQRTDTPSYIERYAHMFDDEADVAPVASEPVEGMPSGPASDETRVSDTDAEHEQSVEEYMTHLMQRTRGRSATDRPASIPVAAPPAAANEPMATSAEDEPVDNRPLASLSEITPSRRPEPSSNLTALRSLANDIARQAIGTYAARRYRRTAVTQIIIAVLAGTTSLYLILNAPSWWDVRCISAAVSLAASVYYLLLTITTLIDSVRASVFEELEQDLPDVDPWHPPLPIDVERGMRSEGSE